MNRLRAEVNRLLGEIPIDFGGGCSAEKAYLMGYLIRRFGMRTTVDIGVYRGRSFFPQAVAHSMYTGGMVYGIDPFDAAEALEHQNEPLKEQIREFAGTTDFQALYSEVASRRETFRLGDHAILLRKKSADAIRHFEENDIRFDLIHIDGNHDTERVTEDVRLYLPRLRRKGFVIMDDVSWDSVKPALPLLETRTFPVFRRVDPGNDYAVYWDNGSPIERMWLRAVLSCIGRK